jgi:hypothetical protein
MERAPAGGGGSAGGSWASGYCTVKRNVFEMFEMPNGALAFRVTNAV